MKIKHIMPCLALLALASGCKTTEQNYRNAYQKAIEARDSKASEDDDLARELGFTKTDKEFPASHPIRLQSGDTITVYPLWLSPDTESGATPENIKAYSVATMRLKQAFNARNICQRLSDEGMPGAFVVREKSGDYLVIGRSFNSPEEAEGYARRVS